jgi:hypothetical protein
MKGPLGIVRGLACLYGAPADFGSDGPFGREPGKSYTYTYHRGCFAEALRGAPFAFMISHDHDRTLCYADGRTSGLIDDARGLAFEMTVPDTDLGRRLVWGFHDGKVLGVSVGATVRSRRIIKLGKGRRDVAVSDCQLTDISLCMGAGPRLTATKGYLRFEPSLKGMTDLGPRPSDPAPARDARRVEPVRTSPARVEPSGHRALPDPGILELKRRHLQLWRADARSGVAHFEARRRGLAESRSVEARAALVRVDAAYHRCKGNVEVLDQMVAEFNRDCELLGLKDWRLS